LSLLAFWGVALCYEGFRIPYGVGVKEIHPAELVFSFWYLGLCIPAVLLIAWTLDTTRLPARVLDGLQRIAQQPRIVLSAALVAGLVAFVIRAWVLNFAPIADDESTYVFIARTLLAGGVVNPSPGDVDFFRNQFIVLNDAAWYGKYPIGHPILLALGEALGLRELVPALITAFSLLVTFALGRLLFPRHQALLGAGLLLVSPQFLFTGATQLSQTSSTLCLLLSVWALLRLDSGASNRFALLAGALLGFGVLIRPFPGVLFVAAAGIWILVRFHDEEPSRQLRRLAAGLVPLMFFAGVFALTQYLQTQDLSRSSYGVYHGAVHTTGILYLDSVAASFSGALLRQNFWLFGWPISFLFLPFASRNRKNGLLWSMVVAEYAYRILVPKTVVAATGPVYVAEVVPLLALLSANGMAGAAHWLSRHAFGRGPERVAGLVMASIAVTLAAFLPIQVRDLHRSAQHRQTVHRLLDGVEAGRSLVFTQHLVDLEQARSWAYYPPNPSPDLSDERVFVRLPVGEGGPQLAYDFWQRRFPDRQPWVFVWVDGRAQLLALQQPQAKALDSPSTPAPATLAAASGEGARFTFDAGSRHLGTRIAVASQSTLSALLPGSPVSA